MSPLNPVRAATATAAEVSVEVATNITNAQPYVTVRFTDIPGCSSVMTYAEWERLVESVVVGEVGEV